MGYFFGSIDWVDVFTPQAPLIETVVRGSLLYLGLVVLLRLTPAREAGAVGTPDLLVILLLADAAQNAMAGPHHAVGDGFALLVTILVWSVALDCSATGVNAGDAHLRAETSHHALWADGCPRQRGGGERSLLLSVKAGTSTRWCNVNTTSPRGLRGTRHALHATHGRRVRR
jgi:hypothetical protein